MSAGSRLWRGAGWIGVAWVALALPLALACSAGIDGRAPDTGPTRSDDAGSVDGGLASVPDVGAGTDAGLGTEADAADPGAYAAACLDGVDQNAGGGVDCGDTSCSAAPSCCVGTSSEICCTRPGASVHLEFACAAPPCADLASFTTFGDVGPVRTADGAFAPQSDRGTDSGGILGEPLDPRASIVTLSARLGVPDGTGEVDAVGLGLLEGGPSAHVVPLAAVVVSAARRQVLLLLGESIAGTAAAPTDGLLHEYTLTVDPSGRVTATLHDGTTLGASVPLPSAPVRAAFFGRATNPGASGSALPARIGSLDVSARGCDQPAALTRVGPVTIVDHTGAALLASASDPSVASDGTDTYLAFAAAAMGSAGASAVFVAGLEGDGAFHVRAPSGATQPLLAPAAGEAYESPALGFASGAWSLYATRVHGGMRSLVVATSASADVLALGAPSDVVVDLAGDVSSPALVPGDPTRLVVRHAGGGGAAPELVLLTLGTAGASATPSAGICGADSSCVDGARAQAHVYAARSATITFDADDVDDPALILHDHVYRLYYAGRLGSRWSIGMLIAADIGYWRPANDGAPILAADGSGFDAVSVRAPSPIALDGALSLYYVGADGDSRTIALAQGAAVGP